MPMQGHKAEVVTTDTPLLSIGMHSVEGVCHYCSEALEEGGVIFERTQSPWEMPCTFRRNLTEKICTFCGRALFSSNHIMLNQGRVHGICLADFRAFKKRMGIKKLIFRNF